jgi:hypothetical protein
MKPMSVVAAVVGGVVGALIWAAISYFTHREIGYVAWAVGGLVGLASLFAGGAGATNGVICAVIALLSILGGKYVATKAFVGDALVENQRKIHAELMGDARDLAKVQKKDDAAIRTFMKSHNYVEKSRKTKDITDEEVDDFRNDSIPMLETMAEEQPTFEAWRKTDHANAILDDMEASLDAGNLVFEDLNAIDLVFGFLGIATAFRIGSGGRKQEQISTTG